LTVQYWRQLLDDGARDARVALRSFRKAPVLTVAILGTLGLGIGGNVAVFAILDAALLRQLPYPRADRLVAARASLDGVGDVHVSGPDFFDYRERATSMVSWGAYTPLAFQAALAAEDGPEQVEYVLASTDFFSTLGVAPDIGRGFSAQEGEVGGPNAVVLSHGLWLRHFGGDPSVLGRSLTVDGATHTVVGVMPQGFRLEFDADLWMPLRRGGRFATARQFQNFSVVGRLAEGVTLARAQDELDGISRGLEEAYPETNRNKSLRLMPLREALSGGYQMTLGLLVAAVVALLLVACSNAASLLVARGLGRRREMAIRAAIGGDGARLVRQLLAESAVLSVGAAAAGLLSSVWLQRLILTFVSFDRLSSVKPRLAGFELGIAVVLAVVTVLLFGVVPAIRSSRGEPVVALRSGSRRVGTRTEARLRNGFVVGQVALTTVLLAVSGLLGRSLGALAGVELGFNADRMVTAEVQLPESTYPDPDDRLAFFQALEERVSELAGVEDVAFATRLPLRNPSGNVRVDRPERFGISGSLGPLANRRWVMPGYFKSMGIPLLSGRGVTPSDTPEAPRVVVLSRQLAARIFSDVEPLGRTVGVDTGGPEPTLFEVVGIVGDVVMNHPSEGVSPGMYLPFAQQGGTRLGVAVHSRGRAADVVAALRSALEGLDPNVLLIDPASMSEVRKRVVSDTRATVVVLGLFSLVAQLMAAMGLYGVLSNHVSRRSREIGIRMALGASHPRVLESIVGHGLALVAAGLALGVPSAYVAASLAQRMLYGVGMLDLTTYGAVVAVLLAVGGGACIVPALRAARIAPVSALRSE